MFKLKTVILLTTALFVSALTFTNLATAQQEPTINVESPVKGATYTSGDVTLKISEEYGIPLFVTSGQVSYSVDDKPIGKMSLTITQDYDNHFSIATGEVVLTNLSQGLHKLSIEGVIAGVYYFGGQAFSVSLKPVSFSFFVNLGVTPKISISSFV